MNSAKNEDLYDLCVRLGYQVSYRDRKIDLCRKLGINYFRRSDCKEVVLVDEEGKLYRYSSVNEASRELNKSTRTINYLLTESKRGWTEWNGKKLFPVDRLDKNGHRELLISA